MFCFCFIVSAVSVTESQFINSDPCDCDVSDKCDAYCYCDPDCNDTQKTAFTFHLPQSAIPIKKIACDTNEYLKGAQSQYIDSTIQSVYGNKCYSSNIELTDEDKIVSYTNEQLGITNLASYANTYSIPTTPSSSSQYYLFNNSVLMIPYGVSSSLCNSYIPMWKSLPFKSKCFPRHSKLVSGPLYDFSFLFPNLCNPDVNIESRFCSSLFGLIINYPSSSTFLFSSNNSRVANRFEAKFNIPKYAATPGNGYQSGFNLLALSSMQYQYLTFNGIEIPFGGTQEFIVDNTTSWFNYYNLAPAYGDPFIPMNAGFTLTLPNKTDLTEPKKIIISLAYKKFGFVTKPMNIFVNTHIQELPTKETYSTVIIKQVELTEDGTSILASRTEEQYSAKASMIFGFMFDSSEYALNTITIIALACFAVVIWVFNISTE